MKKNPTFLLLAGTLLLPAALSAAATFEGSMHMKIVSHKDRVVEMDYVIKSNRARVTPLLGEKAAPMAMIIDYGKLEMTTLMPEKKTYIVMSIKPPEDSAAKQPDELKASLEKTGETEKILGYTCEKYLLKTKDATSELWLTDGLGTFLGLGSGANPMGGWHAKGATAQAWEKALAGKNMFPLRVVGLTGRGKGDRMEVTEIKKESVPDSEFVPPDDFKKFELPPVADMLKGLMKGLTPENQ